jgi:bifunctional enzyme Fae/Hps
LKTLRNPPYLQVALDTPDIDETMRVVRALPESDRIIIEAGTPLIKKYGCGVIAKLREVQKNSFIVADFKTLDVGALEVRIAHEAGADAAVVSGLAFPLTVKDFIEEARKMGIYSSVDMMNVPDPLKALKEANAMPDIILLHRGIDSESTSKHSWDYLKKFKAKVKGKALVGVGGGIDLELAKESLAAGADIVIVGRYITKSPDVASATNSILRLMR